MAAFLTPVLGRLGARWVARRRSRHRPGASPLPTEALVALAPFFPSATLTSTRLGVVPRIRPPFLTSTLARLGLRPLDFDRLIGITFADTVVVATRLTGPALLSTLFHELVHVEQVRQLGLQGFVERYLRGWMEIGSYGAIPLERDAYALQRRFEDAPDDPFDVAAEVARRLAEK